MFLFYYSRLDKRQGCHEIKTDKNGKGIEAMETISLVLHDILQKIFQKLILGNILIFVPIFPAFNVVLNFSGSGYVGLPFFDLTFEQEVFFCRSLYNMAQEGAGEEPFRKGLTLTPYHY